MSWSDRKTLQTLGFALIILGIILLVEYLVNAFIQTEYPCPTVCSVPLYGEGLFLGLALLIIGIIFLIAARGMRPKQETDRSTQ